MHSTTADPTKNGATIIFLFSEVFIQFFFFSLQHEGHVSLPVKGKCDSARMLKSRVYSYKQDHDAPDNPVTKL